MAPNMAPAGLALPVGRPGPLAPSPLLTFLANFTRVRRDDCDAGRPLDREGARGAEPAAVIGGHGAPLAIGCQSLVRNGARVTGAARTRVERVEQGALIGQPAGGGLVRGGVDGRGEEGGGAAAQRGEPVGGGRTTEIQSVVPSARGTMVTVGGWCTVAPPGNHTDPDDLDLYRVHAPRDRADPRAERHPHRRAAGTHPHPHRVFLADTPPDINGGAVGDQVLAVDLPDDLVLHDYEIVEEMKPYREWCVPARTINTRDALRLLTIEEAMCSPRSQTDSARAERP